MVTLSFTHAFVMVLSLLNNRLSRQRPMGSVVMSHEGDAMLCIMSTLGVDCIQYSLFLAAISKQTGPTHILLAFCTRIYNQLTASLTPVLRSARTNGKAHPSKADTPMTSRLAILSSFSASPSHSSSSSPEAFFALLHASNDSRISSTDRLSGESCLLATSNNGRLSSRGEDNTSSNTSHVSLNLL